MRDRREPAARAGRCVWQTVSSMDWLRTRTRISARSFHSCLSIRPAPPGVEALHPGQQFCGNVRLFPNPGGVLVSLGQGRVDMDRRKHLIEADTAAHRQDIFGQQVAGVLADDGDAKHLVLARHGQHLDEAMRLIVGDGAIQIVDAVDAKPRKGCPALSPPARSNRPAPLRDQRRWTRGLPNSQL